MIDHLKAEILAHAKTSPSREICGLVVLKKRKKLYVPCRNISITNSEFEIHPEDYASAEESGEIIAVVHSHPVTNPNPSQADLVGIEQTNLPWVIVNPNTEQFTVTEPSGYVQPYVGREFVHGVNDCYSIWRDFYKHELNIEMANYYRQDKWWLKGDDLYTDNYTQAGMVQIDFKELEYGDILLMKVASPVLNHCAVYLGNNIILHHVMGRLSCKDVLGGYWVKITDKCLRHKSRFKDKQC